MPLRVTICCPFDADKQNVSASNHSTFLIDPLCDNTSTADHCHSTNSLNSNSHTAAPHTTLRELTSFSGPGRACKRWPDLR